MDCSVAPKLPVTVLSALRVTAQVPVPVHAPLHPANEKPVAGVAVRVTCVPSLKLAAHVPGQLMPAGALVTVPLPTPAEVTVSWDIWTGGGGGVVVPEPEVDPPPVPVPVPDPEPEVGAVLPLVRPWQPTKNSVTKSNTGPRHSLNESDMLLVRSIWGTELWMVEGRSWLAALAGDMAHNTEENRENSV
jgi:hypothetical protein